MRRWGFIISGFYAVLVAGLFWPAVARLRGEPWSEAFLELRSVELLGWAIVGLLVAGEALLLFLTVDTSWRHVKPRQHIWVSAAVVGLFVGLLALALVSCTWAAISEHSVLNNPLSPWYEDWPTLSFAAWILLQWTLWGGAFYVYYRGAPARVASAVTWLLTGSVLELLVAVPTHVIVRRRDDCSAPSVTGFGIASGLAVMLACFGPGVLMLYKKRLERYRAAREPGVTKVP